MVAPTYSWNVINATQTDADSVVDINLMDSIREDLIHLEEWLGDGFTAAKDHDHDGVNSAKPAQGMRTVNNWSTTYSGVANGATNYYDTMLTQAEALILYSARITNSAQSRIEIRPYHRYNGGSYYYGVELYNTGASSVDIAVEAYRVEDNNYLP